MHDFGVDKQLEAALAALDDLGLGAADQPRLAVVLGQLAVASGLAHVALEIPRHHYVYPAHVGNVGDSVGDAPRQGFDVKAVRIE